MVALDHRTESDLKGACLVLQLDGRPPGSQLGITDGFLPTREAAHVCYADTLSSDAHLICHFVFSSTYHRRPPGQRESAATTVVCVCNGQECDAGGREAHAASVGRLAR